MSKLKHKFQEVVAENEDVVSVALSRGDYVQTYLLVHSLIEALLRIFLDITEENQVRFVDLISSYEKYLEEQDYMKPTFVEELTEFNRRRNRIVHELWEKGYKTTNEQVKPAANGAMIMYGLFIEWLETFDSKISDFGFRNNEGV